MTADHGDRYSYLFVVLVHLFADERQVIEFVKVCLAIGHQVNVDRTAEVAAPAEIGTAVNTPTIRMTASSRLVSFLRWFS